MKFIVILLFLGIAINATKASPIIDPAIFDSVGKIVSGVADIINGIIRGGQNAVNGAIDVFSGIVKGGNDIGASIASGITNTITGTIVQGAKTVGEISQKVRDAIQKSINSATNSIVAGAAEQYKVQIERIQNQAKEILALAESKLKEINDKSIETLKNAETNINAWAKTQEAKASSKSPEIQAQVKAKTDSFVVEANKKAQECADSITKPVQSIFEQAKNIVQQSFSDIDAAVLKIQECAQIQATDFSKIQQCTQDIREKTLALAPLAGKYYQLLTSLSRLSVESLARSACVSETTKYIRENQSKLSAEIDQLVA